MRYYNEGDIIKIKSARELGLSKLKEGEQVIINGWIIGKEFIEFCGKKFTVDYLTRGAYAINEDREYIPVSAVKRKCFKFNLFGWEIII